MNEDLENILYRIISGFYTINIEDKNYKIISPNIDIKNQAHRVYLSVLDDYKYEVNSWISEKAIDNLLKTYNIWDENKEKLLKETIKDLDKVKIQLYLNFNNNSIKQEIKNKIVSININVNNLYNQKHHFDYLTLDYYAQSIKSQFIIANTVLDDNDKKIFNFIDFENIDTNFLEKIILSIQQNSISINTIKQIARTEIWRSFWGISKENIFEGKVKDWTDEQRSLVNFSKILDSVREHMEAPSEDIIADDDALDGWILHQHEKSEREKKKKEISDRYNLDKHNGNEIFLLTNDKEETKTILNLNDVEAKNNIKEMIQFANKNNEPVRWAEIPHVKRDLKQQIMELNKDARRQ